jgi:hypothetical protein
LKIILPIVCAVVFGFAIPWPWSLAGPLMLLVVVVWCSRRHLNKTNPITAKIAGVVIREDSFRTNFWVKGATGSGKNTSAIATLAHEVFKRNRTFGALILDIRGDFSEEMTAIAANYGRSSDLILLEVRPDGALDWTPKQRLNLAEGLDPGTVAKMVADANATLLAGRDDKGFFRKQATDHIAMALEGLALVGLDVTLSNALEVLSREEMMESFLMRLEALPCPAATKISKHFRLSYRLKGAPEQFEGVRGTIENFLSYVRKEQIAEITCRDSTFDFGKALDSGRLIVVKAPNSLLLERQFISLMLKFRFYHHLLSRFSKSAKERSQENLLILAADESQGIISASENSLGDDVMLALIRGARGTAIFATHSFASYVAVVGEPYARVIAQNLRWRFLCTGADELDAVESADFIGKKPTKRIERSWEGLRMRTRHIVEDTYIIKPHQIRQLRRHWVILVRGDRPSKPRRVFLPPLNSKGEIAEWFGWDSL